MKIVFRLFFKSLRLILGPILLIGDKLSAPKGLVREDHEQQEVDQLTSSLALYQFKTCPFCIKVRRTIKRLSLNIETRDAQFNPQHREQLLQEGGQIKVPCLKIIDQDGDATWLYESNQIMEYLHNSFAKA